MAQRRRSYFINPHFQGTFLLYFVGLSLLNIAIFYTGIYGFFSNFRQKGVELGLQADHVFFTFLEQQKGTMDLFFLVVALLSALFLVVAGILISHRVAGPMHRLSIHLQNLADKERLEKVNFRKGDFFVEVQDAFNAMVERHLK